MTDKPLFSDFAVTHEHEEKLRAESMALIYADAELSRRLAVIEKAMTVIFGYTIDHTSRSESETTVQLLGIRLFNAAASGVKLALSGYYQTAFQQARDIMETGFLLDYFRTSPEQIAVYRKLSELASHATWRGFAITTRQGIGELGPFVEPTNLKAWLHEMVLRLGPSAVMYANQFSNAEPKLERFFQEFGTELVLGFKEPAQ
jgi:hypothetical protein